MLGAAAALQNLAGATGPVVGLPLYDWFVTSAKDQKGKQW